MKKTTLILMAVALMTMVSSCTSYQKMLKSDDADARFQAAKNYYLQKNYSKAAVLFESLTGAYRGQRSAEEVLYLLAKSRLGQKDYYSASQDFANYVKNFPRGEYSEEARYNIGYCLYLDLPEVELDQEATYAAVSALSDFVDYFPESQLTPQAQECLNSINEHLAYKELRNAQLYYKLGLYLGNNYRSAIVTAENALKDYPDTKYKEEFSFIILQAKYKEASLSVAERQQERYSELVDECYRYTIEFPNSKNSAAALRIMKEAKAKAAVKTNKSTTKQQEKN
ncbi:MAG: outer membrane protein assembly factor BamD [Paludibacteraceae bacterium]|nr:outer membrane protein assembly factor BamD [Paludibacteraceae bacterium]